MTSTDWLISEDAEVIDATDGSNDVFFVISGYLISGNILSGMRSGFTLGDFDIRRARRILPALAASLSNKYMGAWGSWPETCAFA
jgi:peptidoglycan/LPS O-acetylase OafA/YrhL